MKKFLLSMLLIAACCLSSMAQKTTFKESGQNLQFIIEWNAPSTGNYYPVIYFTDTNDDCIPSKNKQYSDDDGSFSYYGDESRVQAGGTKSTFSIPTNVIDQHIGNLKTIHVYVSIYKGDDCIVEGDRIVMDVD